MHVCQRARPRADRSASDLLLIFIRKRLGHRQSRLGCRLSAGFAEWVERHGCRESAVRTWMSVRRGPTERDRSEGTPTEEGPSQEQGLFGYFFLGRPSGLLEKVTRRKGGTIISAIINNGYVPNPQQQKSPLANHSAAGFLSHRNQFKPNFPRICDRSSASVLTGPASALRSCSFTLSYVS